jgi:hypothetical protein
LWHLGSSWIVEVKAGLSTIIERKGRELAAHGGHIESRMHGEFPLSSFS